MSDGDSDLVIAVNMVNMLNTPQAFALMEEAGPKMCMVTAGQPGFLGYQANYQIGALPMVGRYGGARPNMMEQLNPLAVWQYTVWDQQESHADFHRENFPRVLEICAHCFPVTVEGPWEPIYRVVAAQMPAIRSPGQIAATLGKAGAGVQTPRYAPPQRVVAMGVHTVKPGMEAAFEDGARAVMEALADAPGFLGYMIMRQTGVSPWGSLQLDPESMMELFQTFGANPPINPAPLFDEEQAKVTPTEYLVHSEWETTEMAAAGIGKVLLVPELRELHNQGVIANLVYGPYVKLFAPMMEEASWREALSSEGEGK